MSLTFCYERSKLTSNNLASALVDGLAWCHSVLSSLLELIKMENPTKQVSSECPEKHSKRVEMSKRKFWYRWMKSSLFIQDVDPYAIFKDDKLISSNAGKRGARWMAAEEGHLPRHNFHLDAMNRSDGLRLPHTKMDRFRWRLAKMLRMFAAYYYAKMILACMVQYTLLRYQQYVSRDQSEPFLSRGMTQKLAQLIGNPLFPLKNTSLLLYVASPGYIFFYLVLLPLYYRRHPMDNAPLRFLLDSKHELRRIDACIRLNLTKVKDSLNTYRKKQLEQLGECMHRVRSQSLTGPPASKHFHLSASRGLLVYQLDQMKRHEEYYGRQMHHLLVDISSKSLERESFRPETFSMEYFARICSLMQPIFWGSLVIISSSMIAVSLAYYMIPYMGRCPELDCNPLGVYSFSEALMSSEMVIISVMSTFIASLNLIQISLITINQLGLIGTIKRELFASQKLISAAQDDGKLLEQVARQRSTTIEELGNIWTQSQHQKHKPTFLSRVKVDGNMLRSLVAILVCDEELARNSRCISMEVLDPLYYALLIIFIITINSLFKVPDKNFVQNFLLAVCWIIVNMTAIACAHIQARVLEFKRAMWSTLAASLKLHQGCYHEWPNDNPFHRKQLAPGGSLRIRQSIRRRTVERSNVEQSFKCCTFVVDMWVKFIHSSVSHGERHNPRLFFVEISYQRLIEANFFAIFVYTFTTRY